MNIALIGYGKMGKEIETVALERGHNIVLKVNATNVGIITESDFEMADVAIEFSRPDAVESNILLCANANVPVVVGTTGWWDKLKNVKETIAQSNQALVYASNFSIGVNLFFELNKKLASLMKNYPQYDVQMKEVHHTQKLDSPSGTAISLAKDIISEGNKKTSWVNHETKKEDELSILSERRDEVPGTHVVKYSSEIDDIEISHVAHNRKGFALGAVIAAEWIIGKKGIFTMEDVLKS